MYALSLADSSLSWLSRGALSIIMKKQKKCEREQRRHTVLNTFRQEATLENMNETLRHLSKYQEIQA